MKKQYIFSLIMLSCLLISTPVKSLEVDVKEIKSKPVVFINYPGTYDRPDTIEAIEDIGKMLAKDAGDTVRISYLKYSVIHAVSTDQPEKFSADIFSIDKNAKVGHIDMVRRITASYLESRYGYSKRDARTLALFLSYYNAIYRKNLTYFSSKYKDVVMKHVSKNNCGISTRYDEWAGATRMLIPLTEEAQKDRLDSIAPDIITDKKTIEQVRRDDKNIPQRKDMTAIKERIIEKDKTELVKQKEQIKEDKKQIEQGKKPVAAKKEEIKTKENELRKDKAEVKKITEPEKQKEKEQEIKKKEEQIEKVKEELKKQESEIAEKEKEITADEKKISEQEEKIEDREKKLESEKKQIEQDEIKRDIAKDPLKAREKLKEKAKELDKREDMLREKELDKNIYANKLYYLKIKEYLDGGHYNNEMCMIDAATRKILFYSPEKYICGSRYDIFSDGVIVITHKGSHTSGHRLTLLDRETLIPKMYGADNVFWRSFIEINDGFIYVILYDHDKHYLGRFDSNFRLVARSAEEINQDTFISFFDNYIYINRVDKTIIVLDKEKLTLIDEVKP